MKLLLHLLRADLRRHRYWLWAWAACSAIELLFTLPGWDGIWKDRGITFSSLDAVRLVASAGAHVLASLMLISSIQVDSTLGTTRFWITRPVTRRLLLAEKLALAGSLAVAGALVQTSIAATFMPGASLLGQVFAEAVVVRVASLLVVSMLAALTLDAGQFLLALVLLAVAIASLVAALGKAIRIDHPPSGTDALLVAWTVLTVTSLVAIVHQTLTRRRSRTLGLVCVGLTVAVVVNTRWTWDFWPPTRSIEAAPLSLPTLSLSLSPANLHLEQRTLFSDGAFQLHGLPDGAGAVVEPLQVSMKWEGRLGVILESHLDRSEYEDALSWDAQAAAAVAESLGATWLNPRTRPNRDVAQFAPLGEVELGTVEEALREPGTLSATALLRVTLLRPTLTLPLQPGTEGRFRATRLSLISLGDSRHREMSVRVRSIRTFFSRSRPHRPVLVVANPTRGQYLIEIRNQWSARVLSLMAVQSEIVPLDTVNPARAPVAVEDAWLAGADLRVFAPEETEVIRRTTKLERVRLHRTNDALSVSQNGQAQ